MSKGLKQIAELKLKELRPALDRLKAHDEGKTIDTSKVEEAFSKAPHKLADCVNRIKNTLTFTKQYGYGYWLNKVKKSNMNYSQINDICKEADGMDVKFRGGWMTKQFV